MSDFKYKFVINYIYELIENNLLKTDQKLPTERSLAKELGVSKTTVNYAINKLIEERVLYKIKNKGTYLRSDSMSNQLVIGRDKPDAFTSNIKSIGHNTESQILSFKVLWEEINLAKIFDDKYNDFYQLIRLRIVNGEPFSIEESYFPFEVFTDANRIDFTKNSLYQYMGDRGNIPVKFSKEVEIIHNPEVNETLHIHQSELIYKNISYGYNQDNSLIEYSRSYTSTQLISFNFKYENSN